ncbi:MAG TPA: hypothetical protein VL551_34065 [Actinospica sp.]|jgi:hypothetical protein|nr:hypothetical protein [Actinospica sp.]
MTATDPHALLEALTEELLRAGFTREADPATGIGRATHRLLVSPDAAVQIHATAYRFGELQATLHGLDPRGAVRAPAWRAGTAALPASALLQAARAAAEPDTAPIEAWLVEAGWDLDECEYDGPRLLEARWANLERTRSACYLAPDEPCDPGGWLITRPDLQSARAHLDATATTPAAVIAALALTD